MNGLIEAAKAVIDATDTGDRWCAIANLKTAVERAENPPSDYNQWTAKNSGKVLSAYEVWTAAQQAERERILDIIHEHRDVFIEGGLCLVVEKIDV